MNSVDKYLYIPLLHGFTDTLARIQRCMEFCSNVNRKLLVSFENTPYKISFDNYFTQYNNRIITDPSEIERILSQATTRVYPELYNNNRKYLTWDLDMFEQEHDYFVTFEHKYMIGREQLPEADIIVFWCQGYNHSHGYFWHDYAYTFLKDIVYKPCITDYARRAHANMPTPYLCIQIRNTGYKSNFPLLYETHKDMIHSYKNVYIATDYRESLDFFREKNVNVYSFTTFQTSSTEELHSTSSVSGDTKILDLFMDMYMIIMADQFLSNSNGTFIKLCRLLHENKQQAAQKYASTPLIATVTAIPGTEEQMS